MFEFLASSEVVSEEGTRFSQCLVWLCQGLSELAPWHQGHSLTQGPLEATRGRLHAEVMSADQLCHSGCPEHLGCPQACLPTRPRRPVHLLATPQAGKPDRLWDPSQDSRIQQPSAHSREHPAVASFPLLSSAPSPWLLFKDEKKQRTLLRAEL